MGLDRELKDDDDADEQQSSIGQVGGEDIRTPHAEEI